jgi:putative transposase
MPLRAARAFCGPFFTWYNKEHRHSGIALMTPEQVHYGMAQSVNAQRARVLEAGFEKNPIRFKAKMPKPSVLPKAAWINKPLTDEIRV